MFCVCMLMMSPVNVLQFGKNYVKCGMCIVITFLLRVALV